MSLQSQVNTIMGVAGGIAAGAAKMSKKGLYAKGEKPVEKSGKDLEMAAKARRNYQQKVNAIYANKELSAKARTRRVGKLLDEYQKGGK